MQIIVGVLSVVYLLATIILVVSAPHPLVFVACLVIAGCIGTICYGLWRDSFAGLVMAAVTSAIMATLATAVALAIGLGAWPALAWAAGVLVGLMLLNWVAGTWRRGYVVLPIEILVLRDVNTLALTTVRGPGRVMRLPFREAFARLPLLTQELLHQVSHVDVMPHGAVGRQIDAIAIEATFSLDAEKALRIFAAPSWQERVAQVLRRSPELRSFLAALKDHGVWQEVFSAVVTQQVELAVRRTARSLGLEPGELSARRDEFEELLNQSLRRELERYGIALENLDVMRMEIAEVTADKQGRALETLAAAELRTREHQLQLAVDHIRNNGLPETPEMIETVMMLIGGLQGRISVLRAHQTAASPEAHAAEEPLKERSWAA